MNEKKSINHNKVCKLCGSPTKLIEAHIFPKSMFSPTGDNKLINFKTYRAIRRPTGAYDKHILCGDCDNKIGNNFEGRAKTILLDRQGLTRGTIKSNSRNEPDIVVYTLDKKDDADTLNRFFLGVLWKASISTLDDFAALSLGPYEAKVKQCLIDMSRDYSDFFSVSLSYLNNLEEKILLYHPKKIKIEGINYYSFIMARHKVLMKVDKRPTPAGLKASILSKENDIAMIETQLQDINEYQGIITVLKKLQK